MLSDRTIPKINTETDPPSHGDSGSCISTGNTAPTCSNLNCSIYGQSNCPTTNGCCAWRTSSTPSCSSNKEWDGTSCVCINKSEYYSCTGTWNESTCTCTATTPARPSSCLTQNECQNDAADCMYGSSGCTTYSDSGYTCYKQTCNSAPSTAAPTPTPTSTTVNCCVDGSCGYCISASYCRTLGGTVVTNDSQCTSSARFCYSFKTQGECEGEGCYWTADKCTTKTSTATPTPTPTSTTTSTPEVNCSSQTTAAGCSSQMYDKDCKWCSYEEKCKAVGETCATSASQTTTCYSFANNTCTAVQVSGTTCDNSNNYYSSWASCRNNIQCGSNEYKYGNSCLSCGANKQVISDNCQGNVSTCCDTKANTTGCNVPNTYNVGTDECKECPVGYVATVDHPTCHINVPAGSYLVNAGGTAINACKAGTYSNATIVDLGQISTCTSCGSGMSSPLGAKSSSECYSTEGVDSNMCDVSVSTTASNVSYTGGNGTSVNDYNMTSGYFTAHVSVYGKGCNGLTMSLSVANGSSTAVGKTFNVSNGSSYNFIVNVDSSNKCSSSTTVTARLSNGNSDSATVNTTVDWHLAQADVCVDSLGYTSRTAAESAPDDTYYIVLNNTKCPGKYEVDIWTKGCGSGGNSSVPANPSTSPEPSVPADPSTPPEPSYACYANAPSIENATSAAWLTGSTSALPYLIVNISEADCVPYACYSNGSDYKWDKVAPSGYSKVANVLASEKCIPESDACYIDSSGKYHWGKYKNNSGYTLITSIIDQTKCKKIDNPACYSDGTTFIWDNVIPGPGYSIVDNVNEATDCHPYENPACYYVNDGFVWGQYATKSGYILVGGINEKKYCNAGCYVDKNNEYVWGNYSDDDNYTLVIDITDSNRCGYTPDVPKTSLNTQMIVYIATAIMSVAGIYFVVRYNNKSKNI